jgi:hypothetical protein
MFLTLTPWADCRWPSASCSSARTRLQSYALCDYADRCSTTRARGVDRCGHRATTTGHRAMTTMAVRGGAQASWVVPAARRRDAARSRSLRRLPPVFSPLGAVVPRVSMSSFMWEGPRSLPPLSIIGSLYLRRAGRRRRRLVLRRASRAYDSWSCTQRLRPTSEQRAKLSTTNCGSLRCTS